MALELEPLEKRNERRAHSVVVFLCPSLPRFFFPILSLRLRFLSQRGLLFEIASLFYPPFFLPSPHPPSSTLLSIWELP